LISIDLISFCIIRRLERSGGICTTGVGCGKVLFVQRGPCCWPGKTTITAGNLCRLEGKKIGNSGTRQPNPCQHLRKRRLGQREAKCTHNGCDETSMIDLLATSRQFHARLAVIFSFGSSAFAVSSLAGRYGHLRGCSGFR
jgi:hypothetical protein